MGDVTRHRGPDDEGLHVDGRCGIGMRRLSIIDLAGGHQPLSNEDGTLWLVCNGEIYNFRELRARTAGARATASRPARTARCCCTSTTTWATTSSQRLNGMFDFALWDARRRRLLIGRDRLGVKPLYVHAATASAWSFATEAKAMLALPGVSAELDPRRAAPTTCSSATCRRRSRCSRHPQAAAGHAAGGRERRGARTALLAPADAHRPRRQRSASGSSACARGIEESVRMQMVSDVPIGAFLSGGVDSSAVVAFMARHTEQPVKTYAIGFDGGEAERALQRAALRAPVAELFGTEHHEIVVKPDVVGLLPQLLWHMDEPIADTAFITTYLVSRVRAPGRHGDSVRRRRRRALRRLPALSGRPLLRSASSACRAGCGARRWRRRRSGCRATAIRRCSTRCAWPRASSPRPNCRSTSATARYLQVLDRARRGRAAARGRGRRDPMRWPPPSPAPAATTR